MFFYNPTYLLFALPALLFGLWAQSKVRRAYNKYARVATASGLTGAQVARRLLNAYGLHQVEIEPARGLLSDHYDPRTRTLRLSPDVHQGRSIAAAGIAAHEMGHALQHAENYAPLAARSAIVPAVQLGSWLGPIIFFVGLGMSWLLGANFLLVAWAGLILFGATAIFTLVTLPVEFDASRRAKTLLVNQGVLMAGEMKGVNQVLDAAALTYVAAAIQAISTLLYYVFILTNSRR